MNNKIRELIVEKFGEKPTKENIGLYLQQNLIEKKEFEELVNNSNDYNIFINYGSYIYGLFGSEYYYQKRKEIFSSAILNGQLTIETIKNIQDKLFMETFGEEIIEKFGNDTYKQMINCYN